MKDQTKIGKIDKSFFEEMSRIAHLRIINKRDKHYSPPTVQRKLIKHPLWAQIKKDLEIAEFLKEDKKGQEHMLMLFRFIIVAFIAVVLFAGLIWVMGILNNTFIDIGIANEGNAGKPGYANMTLAAEHTFGQVNQSIQALRLVAICLIFGEILLVFVFNSFQRVHPALFIVWVFIVFFAVMFSAPVSNAYESLLQSGVYGGLLESFTGSNFILLNLPWVVLLVGVLGGIFMFVNLLRSGSEGGFSETPTPNL
jgi:hypothetical protein